jgi:signal transduction histidine kinase
MEEIEELRREIADLKREMESRSRNLDRLFDNSFGFLAFLKGPDHVYEYVNAGHQKIVRKNFTGHAIKEVLPKALKLQKVMEHVFTTGESIFDEEQPVTIGDKIHYMNANYVASLDETGKIDGVMAWGIDVTEQVTARKKIEETNTSLESERNIRERFVVALTHDLRTPMTAARMNAQLLERKALDPEYVKLASRRIVESVDRSDRMIMDLLDANRIQAGEGIPLKIEECHLEKLIDAVVDDLTKIHGPRIYFQNSAGLIKGFWDPTGLQRIVENLAGNAIKYGLDRGLIEIKLTRTEVSIEVSVHNLGNPIAPGDLAKIFDPYKRTESAVVGAHKGWGIGLGLVKALTEAMSGSVRVESSPRAGTTFFIHLPMDARRTEKR